MMQRAALLTALCLSLLVAACGKGVSDIDGQAPPAAAVPAPPIVLDQFGYRPEDQKIVRVRMPKEGFDSPWNTQPRMTYYVRSADTRQTVRAFELTADPADPVDKLSGDQVWLLDISRIGEPGDYFVTSGDDAQVSAVFTVNEAVYKPVLREAFRTFFYQRAGFEKAAPAALPGWSDGASHLGPGQDGEARLFSAKEDAGTARDLRGGWLEGGDYSQYTNWTSDTLRALLHSHIENPDAWSDDFGIPESGNGAPDNLDEARWGLDWLLRMQGADGAVLSMLVRDTASPPSKATGPSYYGLASTSATLSAAGTFALAAHVFRTSQAGGDSAYADRLEAAAKSAWQWAEANPAVMFHNNDARSGAEGFGSGRQEVDSEYLNGKRFAAAVYLFSLTGEATLVPAMDAAIAETSLMGSGQVDAYRHEIQDAALFLAASPGTPPELRSHLAGAFSAQILPDAAKGYGVPVGALHGGSNTVMARTGMLHADAARLAADAANAARYWARALDYVHYLHGANPMGKVYLTGMESAGADVPVVSVYGIWKPETPIPGLLVGGPNPDYAWDSCCPDKCGSPKWNAICGKAPLAPPHGQPPLKSYLDFDDGWPLNSWQVSQTSIGQQAAYVRLLANFAE